MSVDDQEKRRGRKAKAFPVLIDSGGRWRKATESEIRDNLLC